MSAIEDATTEATDEGEWVSMRASGSRPVIVATVFVLGLVALPAIALVVALAVMP